MCLFREVPPRRRELLNSVICLVRPLADVSLKPYCSHPQRRTPNENRLGGAPMPAATPRQNYKNNIRQDFLTVTNGTWPNGTESVLTDMVAPAIPCASRISGANRPCFNDVFRQLAAVIKNP